MSRLLVPIIFLALSSGCADEADSPGAGAPPDALDDRPAVVEPADATDQALTRSEWTLDAIRTDDGTLVPRYPDASERFRFVDEGGGGRLEATALCRSFAGPWSLSDGVLVADAPPAAIEGCDRYVYPDDPTPVLLERAFGSESLLVDVTDEHLVLTLPTNERLLFSGRVVVDGEERAAVRVLEAGDVASQGVYDDDAFTGYPENLRRLVVYRDQASLDAVYPTLYGDEARSPGPVPTVNFDTTIVVGAFLDVYGYVGPDVTVEHAIETDAGLEIGIRYTEYLDGDPVECASGDAFSGPYTLVAVESTVQPLRFTERTVSLCSGVEAAQFDDVR